METQKTAATHEKLSDLIMVTFFTVSTVTEPFRKETNLLSEPSYIKGAP